MELIFGGLALLVVLAVGGIYFSDRQGWNATFKRVSRIARASLDSRSFKSLERVQTGDKARWEAAYSGRPAALEPLPERKHEIVALNYRNTHLGPWPKWKCKCGHGGEVVVIGALWAHEMTAKRHAKAHVRKANRRDRKVGARGGDGNFLF